MQDLTYINKELGTNYKSNKEIDWFYVSIYYNLSESFMEKFQNASDMQYAIYDN